MNRLRERFPMVTDFGSKESSKRTRPVAGLRLAGFSETYKPADEMQIRKYTEVRYPNWLKQCEKRLQRLHITLQREAEDPMVCFAAMALVRRAPSWPAALAPAKPAWRFVRIAGAHSANGRC
jgi:hypothetical protein